MVKILQVDTVGGSNGSLRSKGLLCSTRDGVIYIEYTGGDMADGEVVTISIKRNGVFRYTSEGGFDRSVGKYEWKSKDGRNKILKEYQAPKQISGEIIVVYADDDDIRLTDKVTGDSYILKGYKEIRNVIDGELLTVQARRVGAKSYESKSGRVITLPVYKCVYA